MPMRVCVGTAGAVHGGNGVSEIWAGRQASQATRVHCGQRIADCVDVRWRRLEGCKRISRQRRECLIDFFTTEFEYFFYKFV